MKWLLFWLSVCCMCATAVVAQTQIASDTLRWDGSLNDQWTRWRWTAYVTPNQYGSYVFSVTYVVEANGSGGGAPSNPVAQVTSADGSVKEPQLNIAFLAGGTEYRFRIYWGSYTTDWVYFKPDALPQVIHVLPAVIEPIPRGSAISFEAFDGHNEYVWELHSLSGQETGGIIQIPSEGTRYAAVTFTDLGNYQVSVYNKSGNGYMQSNIVTIEVLTYSANNFKVPLSNTTDRSVTFKIYQGTELVDTVTLAAGKSVVKEYQLASSTPLTVTLVDSVQSDGVIWTHTTIEETETVVTTVNPDTDTAPIQTNTPNVSQTDDTTAPVWKSVNSVNSGSSVTAQQYAEGVGHIVSALGGGVPVDGSSEVTVDPSGTVAQVESVLSKLSDIPEIIEPGVASKISATFDVPVGLGGSRHSVVLEFDASPYESQISVFRKIFQGFMYVVFFMLYVRTIRNAFAT